MDKLVIAGRQFSSRLMVGTGKFSSNAAMVAAMEASGAEIVTVALRRVDIDNPQDSMLSHIDRKRYLLLPNTSGARDAEEAIRLARLAAPPAVSPGSSWKSLRTPTICCPTRLKRSRRRRCWSRKASRCCPISMPIRCWPNISRKPAPQRSCRWARRSAPTRACGPATDRDHHRAGDRPGGGRCRSRAPSHAAEAMEMGADAVLVNTALAVADDPGQNGCRLPKRG